MLNSNSFIKTALTFANNDELRAKLNSNTQHFLDQVKQAKAQYSNIELARDRATFIRKRSIEALDKYLLRFEANFMKNGGKVVWGLDAESANEQIIEIIKNTSANNVVKAPSSISTEINLKQALAKAKIDAETIGLAEEVLEKKGEQKAHVSHPTLRYNQADIAEGLGLETDIPATSIVNDQRDRHHSALKNPKVAIVEANFLVAESGSLIISENEGNAFLASSTAETLIVLASIDAVTAALNDLDVFLPLYSTFQSGQMLNNYNLIINGPHGKKDIDGPKDIFVVLIDNGRSDVLAMLEQRDALCSLNTGSSALVDPVFRTISGLGYGTSNPGPIGAITEPFRSGVKEHMHLSYATILSAKPSKNSPIKLDINDLLIKNRNHFVNEGLTKEQAKVWAFWKKTMQNRKKLDRRKSLKKFYLNLFFKKQWGDNRSFPELAEKSFNQLWIEKHGDTA